MKIFHFHWVGHLFYLAALACAGFYGAGRWDQAILLKKEIAETHAQGLSRISILRQWEFSRIENNTNAYPGSLSQQISQNAGQAVRCVETFGKKCSAAVVSPDSLVHEFVAVCDTLEFLYGKDTICRNWLERCLLADNRALPAGRLVGMLHASDTADAARIRQNLYFKTELALAVILSSVAEKTKWQEASSVAMAPVLYGPCPEAGVPFKAEIYLASYDRLRANTKVRVNGTPVPLTDGLANITTVFKTPGSKPLKVEMQIQNPLTMEIKTYIKEFRVEVF